MKKSYSLIHFITKTNNYNKTNKHSKQNKTYTFSTSSHNKKTNYKNIRYLSRIDPKLLGFITYPILCTFLHRYVYTISLILGLTST